MANLIATGESRRKDVGDRSKSIFQLEKICRDLQIKSEGLGEEEDIIEKVKTQMIECLKNIPEELLNNPPRVLQRFIDEGSCLTDAQEDLITRIQDHLYQVLFILHHALPIITHHLQ